MHPHCTHNLLSELPKVTSDGQSHILTSMSLYFNRNRYHNPDQPQRPSEIVPETKSPYLLPCNIQ